MSRGLRRTYLAGARAFAVALRLAGGRLAGAVEEDGERAPVDMAVRGAGDSGVVLEMGGRRLRATVLRVGRTVWVHLDGATHELEVAERGGRPGAPAARAEQALSPMTGRLTKLAVAAGETVPEGAELFVVEAMKMEYVVRAPRAIVVASLGYAAGDQVQQGDVVVAFEEES